MYETMSPEKPVAKRYGQPVEYAIEDLLITSQVNLDLYRRHGRKDHKFLNRAMAMTREALRLRKLQRFSPERMTLSRMGIINLGEKK